MPPRVLAAGPKPCGGNYFYNLALATFESVGRGYHDICTINHNNHVHVYDLGDCRFEVNLIDCFRRTQFIMRS